MTFINQVCNTLLFEEFTLFGRFLVLEDNIVSSISLALFWVFRKVSGYLFESMSECILGEWILSCHMVLYVKKSAVFDKLWYLLKTQVIFQL